MMRQERGAAAVEFALVVPVLMAVVFGIVEVGTFYQRQIQLSNGAMIGARSVAHGSPATTAKSAAASAAGVSTTDVTVGTCSSTGSSVTVTINSSKTAVTGLFGSSFAISGKGVARCE
jgi:Flp pilus assembly protein TadG